MEHTLTTPSGKTTRRKRVIKLSEKITIASKNVECWVLEHELDGEGRTLAGKEWHSASVPGFLVRFEQRGLDGMQKVELVEEAEGFEASK